MSTIGAFRLVRPAARPEHVVPRPCEQVVLQRLPALLPSGLFSSAPGLRPRRSLLRPELSKQSTCGRSKLAMLCQFHLRGSS